MSKVYVALPTFPEGAAHHGHTLLGQRGNMGIYLVSGTGEQIDALLEGDGVTLIAQADALDAVPNESARSKINAALGPGCAIRQQTARNVLERLCGAEALWECSVSEVKLL